MNNSDTFTIHSAAMALDAIDETLRAMEKALRSHGFENALGAEHSDILALVHKYGHARRAIQAVEEAIEATLTPWGLPSNWNSRWNK